MIKEQSLRIEQLENKRETTQNKIEIMKKTSFIFLIFIFIFSALKAQDLKTEQIFDWNKLKKSGFIESQKISVQNAPGTDTYYWGVNMGSSPNFSAGYHSGQIAFAINYADLGFPQMYVRCINGDGEGLWAKVLHSKGDHAIDGKLIAKEIEIKINTGADFVFDPDYNLKPLSEVEAFVKENKHLPEIPSEKEMVENGLNVNEMQIKLLQKIEELTLYVISQSKEINELKEELHNIKGNNP